MRPTATSRAGRGSRGPAGTFVVAVLVALVVALPLAGCTDATPIADRSSTSNGDGVVTGAAASLPSADVVDLTVYLRRGHGEDAHLVPVTREVPMVEGEDGVDEVEMADTADDLAGTDPRAHLPRRAVELLVAGPVPDDGAGLAAPLPTTTVVHAVEVSGTTAHVDLSTEVVRDRTSVGASAAHELLALAALANTLTAFPDIDHVELAIDGRRHGVVAGVDVDAFWGWWGLPARLARDESLIGPSPDGIALPDHAVFGTEPQSVSPRTPD